MIKPMSANDSGTAARHVDPWAIGFAWQATIAIDFFAYGGVFASLFAEDDPTTLAPEELFARIPAGYTSFLIEVLVLNWLLGRLAIDRPSAAAQLGAGLGFAFGAALALGVWSFAPIGIALLASWWLVLTLQMTVAGLTLGLCRAGRRSTARRLVLLGFVLLVVATIVLQNL